MSSLDEFFGTVSNYITLYDQVKNTIQPVTIVEGTPQDGWPEGRTEVNTKNVIEKAADVFTAGTSFYEQVKGLFNLGNPSESQPVSPVITTTTPAADPTAYSPLKSDAAIIIIIGVLLLLFMS